MASTGMTMMDGYDIDSGLEGEREAQRSLEMMWNVL